MPDSSQATANAARPQSDAAPTVADAMPLLESYVSGSMPPREARNFELLCQQNPQIVDDATLAPRVARAVRLLDIAGRGADWHEKPRRWWEHAAMVPAVAALAAVLFCTVLYQLSSLSQARREIGELGTEVLARPVTPGASRRVIPIQLDERGVPAGSRFTIGARGAEIVELRIDVGTSRQPTFRVSIDRAEQGSVALLHNLIKDSNGNLRIALNSGALGPGVHEVLVEGVAWNGTARVIGGTAFEVAQAR